MAWADAFGLGRSLALSSLTAISAIYVVRRAKLEV